MSRYNPWLDAAERYPHVHIEWHPIFPAQAFWAPDLDVIIVDSTISRAERRCALAHELAHLDIGDRPTSDCWFSSRQESGADRLAARRLIDIAELAEVLRWSDDPHEVAAELEVTLEVVRARGAAFHPAERSLIEYVLRCREKVA